MKRKLYCLAMLFLLGLAVMTGCGGSDSSGPEETAQEEKQEESTTLQVEEEKEIELEEGSGYIIR